MSLRTFRCFVSAVALVVGGLVILPGLVVHAADHRDGPRITDLNSTMAGSLDLNDLYIFVSPTNRNNTVLVQTMSPGAGIVGPGSFFPGAYYELRISNDGDPLTDEILFQTTFSSPDSSGRQRFVIFRDDVNGGTKVFASGITSSHPVSTRGVRKVTAGIFDDPFFFDVNATAQANRELTLTALGLPTGAPAGRARSGSSLTRFSPRTSSAAPTRWRLSSRSRGSRSSRGATIRTSLPGSARWPTSETAGGSPSSIGQPSQASTPS